MPKTYVSDRECRKCHNFRRYVKNDVCSTCSDAMNASYARLGRRGRAWPRPMFGNKINLVDEYLAGKVDYNER